MLINELLANKKVGTVYGEAVFNEKGESTNLNPKDQETLAETVRGFTYVDESAPKADKKKAVAEEKNAEAEDAEDRGVGQDPHAEKIRESAAKDTAPKKPRQRKAADKK